MPLLTSMPHSKFKKNNYLLTIKMKQGEFLKCYISYFQSQIALIYNCSDDVAATAFTARLQQTTSSISIW